MSADIYENREPNNDYDGTVIKIYRMTGDSCEETPALVIPVTAD